MRRDPIRNDFTLNATTVQSARRRRHVAFNQGDRRRPVGVRMVFRSLARRLLRVSLDARDTMTISSDIAERPNQTRRAMLGENERLQDVTPPDIALGTAENARCGLVHASESWRTRTIVPSTFTPDRRKSNHGSCSISGARH